MSQSVPPPAIFQTFEEKSDPASVAPRIAKLREQLTAIGADAFLVPRADMHRGEQVPSSEARLAWMTGFTGSAGIAIVARQKSVLLVDGRYTLQAPTQTDTAVVDIAETPGTSASDWIKSNLPQGAKIAYDPWLHTLGEIGQLLEKLDTHAELMAVSNPIDAIWHDRPAPPTSAVEILDAARAGQSVADKLSQLQQRLTDKKADALVLTLPESICWLFNIRGHDVPNTPFILGFAVIPSAGRPTLFVGPDKLASLKASPLNNLTNIETRDGFAHALQTMGKDKAVWLDPATIPIAVANMLEGGGATLIKPADPIMAMKARKNPAEIAGMRDAHHRDGVAMAKFLHWFDQNASQGTLDEIDIVQWLESFRRQDETLVDISFDTISGAGPNGAIVHYRVTENTNRKLNPGELMLVDSGGQYLSGTTDITRTLFTGSASDEMKDRFTRVLKGMILVSRARFPKGTTGAQLDTLARDALWNAGLNYAHGTGHGVGAYLSVHEGPVGIAPRYTVPLEPGNVISNEPGYYKTGAYGIRIENLVHVIESPDFENFLEFETLTLVPIDRRLIEFPLLTHTDVEWINAYHARVFKEIGPMLESDVRDWMEQATKPI